MMTHFSLSWGRRNQLTRKTQGKTNKGTVKGNEKQGKAKVDAPIAKAATCKSERKKGLSNRCQVQADMYKKCHQ